MMQNRKKDFPVLQEHPDLIYLDSAATSLTPHVVIDEIVQYYTKYSANTGRGVYQLAEDTTQKYEHARFQLARWFGVQASEIMFAPSATLGINYFVRMWGAAHITKGDTILLSDVEHHANIVPWIDLAKNVGAQILTVSTKHGLVDQQELVSMLKKHTPKVVSIVHTSNIFGTTNDIRSLADVVHAAGSLLFVDGCQSAPHQVLDLKLLGCDAFVCSAHKMLGPTGVGLLYVRKALHDHISPGIFGGGMVYSVDYDKVEYKSFPHGFEPGTQPLASVFGWGRALTYLQQYDLQHEAAYKAQILQPLYDLLHAHSEVTVVTPNPAISPGSVITWYHHRFHAHDIAAYLDRHGIAVRAGNHCVQPYHTKHKLPSTIRMSVYVYNDSSDILQTCQVLEEMFKLDLVM